MFKGISVLTLRRVARRWLPIASIPLIGVLALGVLALRAQPHPVAATVPSCSTPAAAGSGGTCASPTASAASSVTATATDTPSATATATAAPTDTASPRPTTVPTPTPFPSTGESAVLQPCKSGPEDRFGSAVASTPDGNELVVGAPGSGNRDGAAYILTRNSAGWTEQAQFVVADAPQGAFGYAVAVSADGSTALIGANLAGNGKAYVFSRDSGGWHQTAELAANDGRQASDAFASTVSLSADGRTALISRVGYSWPSQAFVFTKTSGWALTATLGPTTTNQNDGFGAASALAASGTRLVLGDPSHSTARVYDLAGGTWTQSAALTVPNPSWLGREVAISADGSTVLAGSSGDQASTAGVTVFKDAGGSWTTQGTLANPGAASGGYGTSLALTANGSAAYVGEYGGSFPRGTIFVFTPNGGTWSKFGQLHNPVPVDYDGFGWHFATSADGSVVAVGAPMSTAPGAVIVYDGTTPHPPATLHC